MESKKLTLNYNLFYMAIFVIASIPLSCAYVMEGGEILIWLARIEEVREGLQGGQLLMFPSAELTVARGAQISALYSNIWLLIPAGIRVLGGTITFAYRIYLLLLNVIALLAAKKMFECLFEDKTTVLSGVLLYMTSPYRIYICYDKGSLGLAAAWSLIPLVIWGMIKIFRAKADWKALAITAAAFAGIGYADGVLWLMTIAIGILGVIWYRKIAGLLPVIAGSVLYAPGLIYFLRYLLKGGMEVWNLPLESIASEGYVFGQFFSSWVYRENHPGLGMGLVIALLVLLWMEFMENNLQITKKYGYFLVVMLLFSGMSMSVFPWDVVQRVGAPFLRLVPLMGTPGICFGFATLAACVLGVYGVECAGKQKKAFVKIGLPMIVMIAAVGIAVYTCNTLTYSRMPMYLIDSLP